MFTDVASSAETLTFWDAQKWAMRRTMVVPSPCASLLLDPTTDLLFSGGKTLKLFDTV
jgi:hypothetical protein